MPVFSSFFFIGTYGVFFYKKLITNEFTIIHFEESVHKDMWVMRLNQWELENKWFTRWFELTTESEVSLLKVNY